MQTAIIVSVLAILLAYLASFKFFKYGLEIAMALITIFVAIRYEWGTDMPSYYMTYQAFADSGLNVFDFDNIAQIRSGRSLEIGWAMLNVLCRPIGFFGMIILLAIVENLIIYDFIKRNADKQYYWLAIFIYTMNPYMMVLGCSMLRQWLAMCVVLFSTRFIQSEKLLPFILCIIIAASFHTSALLFIALYLFRYFEKFKLELSSITWLAVIAVVWIIMGSALSTTGVMMLLSTDAFEGYTGQMEGHMQTGGLGFGTFFKILIYLYCIVTSTKLTKEKRVLCWLLLMYIFLFPFTDAVSLASRLNFYVDAIAIVAVPLAMKASNFKAVNVVMIGFFIFWNLFLYRMFFDAPSYYFSYRTYHTIFETTWQ